MNRGGGVRDSILSLKLAYKELDISTKKLELYEKHEKEHTNMINRILGEIMKFNKSPMIEE